MAKTKIRQSRVWLEPSSDTFSSVCWYTDEYDRDAVNVRIADCNKIINLWFNGKKGLKKFDRLLKALHGARDELDNQINGE